MTDADRTSRSQRRLAEELEDDRIGLPGDDATGSVVVEELDYARRTPMFEGRRPVYGAMITTAPENLQSWSDVGVDVVDASCNLEDARSFADGRACYLVRNPADPERIAVACFDRPLLFEADLVLLQEATGALVVQRTPVFGVTRLFEHDQVVSWDGRSWSGRATARSLLPGLQERAPELEPAVAHGLLTLAIHWLAPARAGATLVVHRGVADSSFDTSGAVPPPALTLTDRRHFPPLLSCLMQRDLATLIDTQGAIQTIGVGLLSTATAEAQVGNDHGMRHRSAQRWSFDHPEAIVAVVSSDGPVTVYRAGEPIIGEA
ncbi:MAG: hypothetical protein GEV08_01970 [Acidimicrobiia bacterium]|nr:hypothetical protein [Acidimicrobiia bacterium]